MLYTMFLQKFSMSERVKKFKCHLITTQIVPIAHILALCTVADPDIRNVRKFECQIFDRQNLSCEILRNHEKVDRIMHLVAKLSDFCLFHPGFFSFFYNRFYLSSHLCEADSLSTSEALIGILAILNVYGSVTEHLRSSSASCESSPQCLPQKAY